MSGDGFVLDTNVVLNMLKNNGPVVDFVTDHLDSRLYTSVITRIELLSFHGITTDEEEAIQRALHLVTVVPLDNRVERIAIALRRETRCKTADAIVAATAIHLGVQLVTGDKKLSTTFFPGLASIHLPPSPR